MWLLWAYTDLQQGNQMSFKELQKQAGLNNIDTARYLGVSLRTVQRWVKGCTQPPMSAMLLIEIYINKKVK